MGNAAFGISLKYLVTRHRQSGGKSKSNGVKCSWLQYCGGREGVGTKRKAYGIKPVYLLDGTVHHLPEALIYVDTPHFTGNVRAKCMSTPLYDLFLGSIDGMRSSEDPHLKWHNKRDPELRTALKPERGDVEET